MNGINSQWAWTSQPPPCAICLSSKPHKSFLSQHFYPFEVWLIHFYFWFEYIDPRFTKLCNQMLSLIIGSNFHTFNTHNLQYVLISGPSDHTIQVCLGFLAIFIVIIFSRNFPLPYRYATFCFRITYKLTNHRLHSLY